MDFSVTFARHFTRLVWLLLHEPANTDEQKAALRALTTVSKDGAVTLAEQDHVLTANGSTVSTAFAGVSELQTQMTAHGVKAIIAEANAGAADLLGVARILASPATSPSDGGAAAEARRAALGGSTVTFTLRPAPGALPDLDLVEMVDEPVPEGPTRAQKRAALEANDTPRSDGGGGMFDQFGAPRVPSAPLDTLLMQLDTTEDAYVLTGVLEDLVLVAESAARDARSVLVLDILHHVTKRETQVKDTDAKRAFTVPLRRMAKAPLMRAVALQIPHAEDRRDDLVAVLARAGEDGADAVVELLASVAAQSDRRAYFDVLLKLKAGVPTLIHMLGDQRWFVARNAAELLGEMQARDAEQPLTELLRHDDDRVRRSATGALMRLGTPKALQAIQDALKSDQPQMRMQAAAALVTRKDVRPATLIEALDDEKDEEVQAAFLFALGKLATRDAVQRLLEAVKPDKGLFKKKTLAYRVAAVQALAEARTRDAVEALKLLSTDKDEDIRDAASFALGRVARALKQQ